MTVITTLIIVTAATAHCILQWSRCSVVVGIHNLISSNSRVIIPILLMRKPRFREIKKRDQSQTARDSNPGLSGSIFCAHLPVGLISSS